MMLKLDDDLITTQTKHTSNYCAIHALNEHPVLKIGTLRTKHLREKYHL